MIHDHDRSNEPDDERARPGDRPPAPGKQARTDGHARRAHGAGGPSGASTSGASSAGTPTAGTPTAGTPTAGTPTSGTPAVATSSTRPWPFVRGSLDDPMALHLHSYARHGSARSTANLGSAANLGSTGSVGTAGSAAAAPGAPAALATTGSGDAAVAARIVVDRAAYVRGDVGLAALLDAATMLMSVVETARGPLAPDDDAAVAAAVAVLVGIAAEASPIDAVRLEDRAAQIDTFAAHHGVASGPTRAPRSRRGSHDDAAAAGDPIRRLQLAADALTARVDRWGGLYHDGHQASLLREESGVLATLVREATAAVHAIPKDELHGRADAPRARVMAIGDGIELLYRIGRGSRAGQAAVGLDQVFLAEDALFLAADLDAPQHRRRFYADRNAGDLDGRDPRDPTLPDSARLIDGIRDWFRAEATFKLLAVEGAETVMQEPERAPPPSAVEAILAAAASAFLGSLPGRLLGALEGALAGAGSGDGLLATLREVADPPIDRAMAPLQDGIEAAPARADVGSTGAGGRAGPLATAFLVRCRRDVARYVGAVHQQLPALTHALELVPPAGLQSMLDGLAGASAHLYDQLRRDLLVQWMTVVHGALSGRDARGHSARGGTIATVIDRPGAIQLALVVTDAAPGIWSVRVGRCSARGVGGAVVAELRAAAVPIATLALDRFVAVAAVDAYTGAEISLGEYYLGPDGALDVSGVQAPLALARLGRQEEASAAPPSIAAAIDRGASTRPDDIERAAHLLLARAAVTTASLA